jgi:dTDP-glucose pyrophosphorylase
LERRIQAEADRRLDKFQREEAQRRKATEERELREKDPYGYVELLKQREQEAEVVGKQLKAAQEFAITNVRTYDSAVLDPIMAAVPSEERQRILGSIGDGIPGRAQAAAEAMKILHKTWKDQGRAEARKVLLNDQAFVKEVLARYGGQRQEPESAPAVASSGRSFNMNDLIRGAAGRG